jgi:hypothetical protein
MLRAIAIIGVVAGLSLFGIFEYQARQTTMSAGFWFDDFDFAFPGDLEPAFGGHLTPAEIATIKEIANEEVHHAFDGYRMAISETPRSFWRVAVVRELGFRLPWAGATISMGPLGGLGRVAFTSVAINALSNAPPGASRQRIVEGIGKGVGRSAVHEFAHQILGSGLLQESDDRNAYECETADRAEQYYGVLRWTTARAALERRIGPRKYSNVDTPF